MMGRRAAADRQPRLGQRLIANARVAMAEKLADFGTVFRNKRIRVV
jgi:hypothetical protein